MNSLRLDVELTTVEPAGAWTFVEGRAADGAQIALYLAAESLRGSALAAGQRVALTLELPAATTAAPPPLRERMARPAAAAPKAAASPEPEAALISSIFGERAPVADHERDIDDEMDALFGRMKRGSGQ